MARRWRRPRGEGGDRREERGGGLVCESGLSLGKRRMQERGGKEKGQREEGGGNITGSVNCC